jgi:hypothetical protein
VTTLLLLILLVHLDFFLGGVWLGSVLDLRLRIHARVDRHADVLQLRDLEHVADVAAPLLFADDHPPAALVEIAAFNRLAHVGAGQGGSTLQCMPSARSSSSSVFG